MMHELKKAERRDKIYPASQKTMGGLIRRRCLPVLRSPSHFWRAEAEARRAKVGFRPLWKKTSSASGGVSSEGLSK